MLLPKFEFHEPTTMEDACRMMSQFGATAKLLAGGTDLVVNMKRRIISPAHVVSLSRIDILKQCYRENDCFRIGACVTVCELAESDVVKQTFGALASGAINLGSPLIRNLATIGGNIGAARPAADLPPSLMAYEARLILKSSSGERKIPLDRFFMGPGLTDIRSDEVIYQIEMDVPSAGVGAGYLNIGIRKAQDCNLVNVASLLALDDDGKTIKSARIVMGCVGPTHLLSRSAEKVLVGEKADGTLFAKAALAAGQDSRPIDDFRGSAAYRREMVEILTKRTLVMALEHARAYT